MENWPLASRVSDDCPLEILVNTGIIGFIMQKLKITLALVALVTLAACDKTDVGTKNAPSAKVPPAEPAYYAKLYRAFPEESLEDRWELLHPNLPGKANVTKQKWIADAEENRKKTPGFGKTYCDKPTYKFTSPTILTGEQAKLEYEIHCGNTLMRTTPITMEKHENEWLIRDIGKSTVYIDTNSGKLTAIR